MRPVLALAAVLAPALSWAGASGLGVSPQDANIISTFSATNPGFTRAQQNGSYTVTPGTGTFPVSAASLPLPSGAATDSTLATRATESTQVAISTTNTAILNRLLSTLSANVTGSTVGVRQLGSFVVTPGTGSFVVASVAGSEAKNGILWNTVTGVQTKVGATEEPVLLFVNLSTNTKEFELDKLYINSIDQGVNLIFRLYTAPVVTSSGTALTIFNSRTDVTTSNQAQAYLIPTVSSNGQPRGVFQVRDAPVIDELSKRVILTPGKTLLFTLESSGNNKKWALTLSWVENTP